MITPQKIINYINRFSIRVRFVLLAPIILVLMLVELVRNFGRDVWLFGLKNAFRNALKFLKSVFIDIKEVISNVWHNQEPD